MTYTYSSENRNFRKGCHTRIVFIDPSMANMVWAYGSGYWTSWNRAICRKTAKELSTRATMSSPLERDTQVPGT